MRGTLPSRPVLRTPACPGFRVSGVRKSACFDRYCCNGAISRERLLAGLPCGWVRADADGATRGERSRERGFERVQMRLPGKLISEDAHGGGESLPIERVQMDWGSGVAGRWEPCRLSAFERVQMTPAVALIPLADRQFAVARTVIEAAGQSVTTRLSWPWPMNTVFTPS